MGRPETARIRNCTHANTRPRVQLSSRLAHLAIGSLSAFMNQLRLLRCFRSSVSRSELQVMARANLSANYTMRALIYA